MATWSVVTTVKEPLDVVLRFVSYHLDLGADHIFVFFDDPHDIAYEIIKQHPQVTAILRSKAFWFDKVDDGNMYRHLEVQNFNAMHAYSKLKTEWMVFIDGDEYLYSDYKIGNLLDECKSDIVIARTSEPAFVNEENFSTPVIFHSRVRGGYREVFSSLKPEFYFRGLVGHSAGKSFFRRGLTIQRMRVHKPDVLDAKVEVLSESLLTVVHYLNFGIKAWAGKLMNRIERGRYKLTPKLIENLPDGLKPKEQMWQEVYALDGVDGLVQFFKTHKIYSDEIVHKLVFDSHLSDFEFDFSDAIARHFSVTDFANQNEKNIFIMD